MRILVIGNGFIATSIVKQLESENHELLVFSRKLNQIINSRQVFGDIFDFKEFIKTLDWKPEIIINTAWVTTPGIYRDDVSNFRYSEFTRNLAQYVTHSGVSHLIVLGTCAEYGRQVGPSTAGMTKLSPSTLYAEQKVVALNSVKKIFQESDMRFTWARVFYPYGPNQDKRRLIPHVIQSLKDGKPIILSDITSVHDWITTRDIASAISWIISKELPMEVDIGTSIGYTNLELLIALEKLLQTTNQLSEKDTHILGNSEVFVASKISPLFLSGWSPTDSLTTGLEWMLRE
jgi:nucleoside-diphosphate-sugar epimerase